MLVRARPIRSLAAGLARCLALLGAAVMAGCGTDGPSGPTPQLVVVGRLERGATVRLVARGGSAGDSTVGNVTISPSSAGTVEGSTVTFRETGPVTLGATASDGRALTTSVTVAAPPTLFFDGVVSGNRDIYSIELDGAGLTRWTTAPLDDSHPSATAGRLVFISTRDGNAELYALATATGATEERLTSNRSTESAPALARGGATVAYVSDSGGSPRIFLAAPTAGAPKARLTASGTGFPGSIESSPSWAPAGDRIVFVSTVNGKANLFVTSSTPGSVPALAATGATETDVEPAWSPDGGRIAFASTRAGGTDLFLLDVQTGVVSQIAGVPANSGQPAWLPDGRLLFTSFAGGTTRLFWIDPAEASPHAVEIPTGTTGPAHPAGVTP